MDERLFLQTVQTKAKELGVNALLLLSGIEGLYTFRDVPMNGLNYAYLDSLILTIFALRIGDHFHGLAEQNLVSGNVALHLAAQTELAPLSATEIEQSANPYLQSFARLLGGKSTIRRYHEKALEAAALEIEKTQARFGENSIGAIVLYICMQHLGNAVDLSFLFAK